MKIKKKNIVVERGIAAATSLVNKLFVRVYYISGALLSTQIIKSDVISLIIMMENEDEIQKNEWKMR